MPHILIEFAQPLLSREQIPPLIDAVYSAACSTQLFDEKNIKIRAIPIEFYRVGSGTKTFIHTQLKIHAGRNQEQKRHLSQTILNTLTQQNTKANIITVEVIDMDKSTYAKATFD